MANNRWQRARTIGGAAAHEHGRSVQLARDKFSKNGRGRGHARACRRLRED